MKKVIIAVVSVCLCLIISVGAVIGLRKVNNPIPKLSEESNLTTGISEENKQYWVPSEITFTCSDTQRTDEYLTRIGWCANTRTFNWNENTLIVQIHFEDGNNAEIEYSFDREGKVNLVKARYIEVKYTYRDNKAIVSAVFNGEDWYEYVYEYNGAGKIIKKTGYNYFNDDDVIMEYGYDNQNRLSYITDGWHRHSYTYFRKKVIEKQISEVTGESLDEITYKYSDSGNLEKCGEEHANGELGDIYTSIEFDNNNNPISIAYGDSMTNIKNIIIDIKWTKGTKQQRKIGEMYLSNFLGSETPTLGEASLMFTDTPYIYPYFENVFTLGNVLTL